MYLHYYPAFTSLELLVLLKGIIVERGIVQEYFGI
jgi:hypothetical protein